MSEKKISTKEIVKIIAKTIIVIAAALFELIMLAFYAGTLYFNDFEDTSMTAADMPPFLFMFGCFFLISFAEIIRIIRRKKWILLPMLGMKFVSAVAGIAFMLDLEVFRGDADASLGAAITMTVLTLVLIGAGFGIRYIEKMPKKVPLSETKRMLAKPGFTDFSAEWYWDEASAEYSRIHGLDEDADDFEYTDEMINAIYIYACGYIAYLFLWLAKRGGLEGDLVAQWENVGLKEDFRLLLMEKKNPSEILYNYYDGKLRAGDVKQEFLDFLYTYYEPIGSLSTQPGRETYETDYDRIVLGSVDGAREILYCRDFDYEAYHRFEKVLDERYERFQRNFADFFEFPLYRDDFYSNAFEMSFEVYVQKGVTGENEAFPGYADRCLEQISDMPANLLKQICEEFNSWGEEGQAGLAVDELKNHLSSGQIFIFRPYGYEIAYALLFEADFESEHGVSIVIRDGYVLFTGYSLDALSPWCDEMEKELGNKRI